MGYYGRTKPAVAPERQRKINELTAAATSRGLRVSLGYRGSPLVVGGRGWELSLDYPTISDDEGRKVQITDIRRGSYEDLLATLTDDLLWAQHVHHKLGHREATDHHENSRVYARNTIAYGHRCEAALRAELEALDGGTSSIEGARVAVESARKEAERAYGACRQTKATYDAYVAAAPQDQEQARAYLERVTVVPRGQRGG